MGNVRSTGKTVLLQIWIINRFKIKDMSYEILPKQKATSVARYVKVDVCSECRGTGKKSVYVGRSVEDEYEYKTCRVCGGSGMVKKELTVSIFPYDNKKSE